MRNSRKTKGNKGCMYGVSKVKAKYTRDCLQFADLEIKQY